MYNQAIITIIKGDTNMITNEGIIWDAKPAQMGFYSDHYIREDFEDGSFSLTAAGLPVTEAPENTDIRYVLDRYISIGKIKSHIIK